MNYEDWLAQFKWHLKRRTCIDDLNGAGIEDDELRVVFAEGESPLEAVRNIIEERGLDDCLADPWCGPSQDYWKKWEENNPFPHSSSIRLRRAVPESASTLSN